MKDETSAPPPAKRAYHSPSLRYLGTIAELTQAAGTLPATEPLFNQTPKQSP